MICVLIISCYLINLSYYNSWCRIGYIVRSHFLPLFLSPYHHSQIMVSLLLVVLLIDSSI
uniref:Uncharacterized protein n=1 Tax=Lepeophtheirus salmonis TaxID=72036 RepID=A0A0K2UKV0_LEPSM